MRWTTESYRPTKNEGLNTTRRHHVLLWHAALFLQWDLLNTSQRRELWKTTKIYCSHTKVRWPYSNPENYREISLTSIICKIFSRQDSKSHQKSYWLSPVQPLKWVSPGDRNYWSNSGTSYITWGSSSSKLPAVIAYVNFQKRHLQDNNSKSHITWRGNWYLWSLRRCDIRWHTCSFPLHHSVGLLFLNFKSMCSVIWTRWQDTWTFWIHHQTKTAKKN